MSVDKHAPVSTVMAHILQSQETQVFVRCLIELALASNAPTSLKTQVRTWSSLYC